MAMPGKRYGFGWPMRMHGRRAFASVFDARCRKPVGPITVCGVPNALGHSRLGLSVPRKVGTAVRRNRIKRLLREAFRLSHHDWPDDYDVVVVVRPHDPMGLGQYQAMLSQGVRGVHRAYQRQGRAKGAQQDGGDGSVAKKKSPAP